MLKFSKNKYDCTGCTACYAACPVKCISMVKDEEGFLYPTASDKCINCGKCEQVCPRVNEAYGYSSFTKSAYAAITRDKHIWKRSSSGGAFSEICKAWNDDSTVFVGAAWKSLEVHHIVVEKIADIGPLCKSKYIASSMDDCFVKIKEHLSLGKKVVFCGVPCQVAGLKNYLNKDYEKLLLIDVICHGVGSPSVFRDCVNLMGEQFGINVERYEFRHKKNYFFSEKYLSSLSSIDKEICVTNDPYIQLFGKQTCMRPSCGEHCIHRNESRQGDITIADFFGIDKVFPELVGAKRNYSTIVFNSEKGASIVETLKKNMEMHECSVEIIKENNPLFSRQTWFSNDRDLFFNDYINEGEACLKKYVSDAVIYKRSIAQQIFDALPVKLRRMIMNRYKLIQKSRD